MEILDANGWRSRDEQRRNIALAWHMACFYSMAKVGKLEGLDHYLPADADDPNGGEQELSDEASEMLLRLLAKHGRVGS